MELDINTVLKERVRLSVIKWSISRALKRHPDSAISLKDVWIQWIEPEVLFQVYVGSETFAFYMQSIYESIKSLRLRNGSLGEEELIMKAIEKQFSPERW